MPRWSMGARRLPPEEPTTSFGWGITPDALRRVLVRVAADYTDPPLYITENGACFDDYVDPEGRVNDVERVDYLAGYFAAAAKAIAEGVDLRGYFVWSLLDNFEWAKGYSKRFGLVFVEYGSQRRIPKASAHWLRERLGAGAVTEPG